MCMCQRVCVSVQPSVYVCVKHTLGHTGLCEGGMARGIKEIELQPFNS